MMEEYIYQKCKEEEYIALTVKGKDVLLNLSTAGMTVFAYICRNILLTKNDREVVLSYKAILDEGIVNITRYKYGKGIKDCLNNNIITKTNAASLYFVNRELIQFGKEDFSNKRI